MLQSPKMTANNNRHAGPGKPSLIEHKNMNIKFLIVNRPTQATLPQFVKVGLCDVDCWGAPQC